ncbi:UDP-N-acetylglucosamine 1-carboxyvinyltransferase [Rhodothalassium salexigens]|uniref:UDP-N-acetylglucosamine 1-carboxyvinyltransferase n=1 Tax=Rhodothalassium salexigens TaxID=1086 RepID=UPI001912C8DA|nr:UDP-N-acetylglucosamine 1-carboxyvinyltransferase [Rhodothalassium salexigens]MBK5919437.1 UDP-N-acetylglucosamine 1-carboxyvinyltransferase [Rhodothalassium salexigens]
MEKLLIRGGRPLAGRIAISGAKNAALPLMAAALLSDRPLRLTNLPRLADITTMADLLNHLGVSVMLEGANGGGAGQAAGRTMELDATTIADTVAPYDMVRRMRASVLVLGPLLARCGEAIVSLPGGCAIGTRPIDLHLDAMRAMGAEIALETGYVHASAPRGLVGGRIVFPKVSVGATENALMAASLARGETVIDNAAREPEIVDLAQCLTAMGARIAGAGTATMRVQGVAALGAATHAVLPDRIEAGSYAMAAAITGGDVDLVGARADLMAATVDYLQAAGAEVTPSPDGLRVRRAAGPIRAVDVETAPFPGFATDMQAQAMALMTLARGTATLSETIFENRFMHVSELLRLGARIHIDGGTARVTGVERLIGAPVMATDLRASMSLVLAGLAAEGETEINRLYHLDRGYERLEMKLAGAGADIERVPA